MSESSASIGGERLWSSTLQANSARLQMLREVDSRTMELIDEKDGEQHQKSQSSSSIHNGSKTNISGDPPSSGSSYVRGNNRRLPRKSGQTSKRSFIVRGREFSC